MSAAAAARTDSQTTPDSSTVTSREAMDAAVRDLQAQRKAWTLVSVRDRIALLDAIVPLVLAVSDRWAAEAIAAEKIDPGLGGGRRRRSSGPTS